MHSLNRFKIEKYTPRKKKDWNNMVKNLTNNIFFFHRDYLSYFKNTLKENSLIIYDNKKKKIIGFIPGNISKNTFYSFEKLTFGGVFLEKLYYKNVFFNDIFNNLIKYLKKKKVKKLFFKLLPSPYYTNDNALLLNYLNNLKKSKIFTEISSYIKLSKLNNFSKLRLRSLYKNKDLIIKKEKITKKYWNFVSKNLRLKYKVNPVHSYKEIKFLEKKFPKNILFFSCYKRNIFLGGLVLFRFGNILKTQYVGFDEKYKYLNSQDSITSYLIKNNKSYDVKILDFGISTENNGKFINKNLLFYKETFGAINFNYFKISCYI
tara:strand:+ start:1964 stop:2920 length:957 start_codon:yes stop_codon:yes gene_type:complete